MHTHAFFNEICTKLHFKTFPKLVYQFRENDGKNYEFSRGCFSDVWCCVVSCGSVVRCNAVPCGVMCCREVLCILQC